MWVLKSEIQDFNQANLMVTNPSVHGWVTGMEIQFLLILTTLFTDGRNGFLVEPENPAQLAERILFVLSDDVLRKKMSARNMAWAEQHTWGKVVDMLEGAYSEVV